LALGASSAFSALLPGFSQRDLASQLAAYQSERAELSLRLGLSELPQAAAKPCNVCPTLLQRVDALANPKTLFLRNFKGAGAFPSASLP
jgi:hypothetical protein